MDFRYILEEHTNDFDESGRDHIFEIGDKVLNKHSSHSKPSFSYNYLNISTCPEYCFNHLDFDSSDYNMYFQNVRRISKLTYHELLEQGNKKEIDFTIYTSINSALKKEFNKLINNIKLSPEQTPTFGRIGLYNSSYPGGKAPRIFFFVGHHCMLHILFFDPYHQLYPEKK